MGDIKLIVGLGNPGKKYRFTRHNIGFLALEYLVEKEKWKNTPLWEESFIEIDNNCIYLLKPLTFMNLSGIALKEYLRLHPNITPRDTILIHDDLDMPWGKVKIKRNGGSGGHKGVQSCIDECNSKDFYRLKIGIGRPTDSSLTPSQYVLSEFDIDQKFQLCNLLTKVKEIIETIVLHSIEKAMNIYNNRNLLENK